MDEQNPSVDLLNELASGEDEFDVDLMACGCRLAVGANLQLSIHEIVRLHELDHDKLIALVGALVDKSKLDAKTVFKLAQQAGRGTLKEPKK